MFLNWLFHKPEPPPPPPPLPEGAFDFLDITEKPWGWSKCSQQSSRSALYELTILRHGYSSIHFHEHKCQLLVVQYGTVYIKEYDDSGTELRSAHLLRPGHACLTPARRRHQFFAAEASVIAELYLPSVYGVDSENVWRSLVRDDDIVRLSDGGIGAEGGADIPEFAGGP